MSKDIFLALDAASSEFFEDSKYQIEPHGEAENVEGISISMNN